MRTRLGYVANSSSSSFIVAIRKGYTWEQMVEEAGWAVDFARDLIAWLQNRCPELNSAVNMPLAQAKKYYDESPEELLAIANEEFGWLTAKMESLVDDPDEWFFGMGYASYNDSTNPIEVWLGWGGRISGPNFKVVPGEI